LRAPLVRRAGRAAAAGLLGLLGLVSPAPCGADPISGAIELARPIGDVYDERTADGDAYPQSLGVRVSLTGGDLAATLDYRRNVSRTESGAAGSLTRYALIEGGFGTAVPFLARDSSFEVRIERKTPLGALYAGVGAIRTWANYDAPSLTGLGAGLELRADGRPGLRPFGSAYYYPFAPGRYVTESAPHRTLTPAFGIVRLDTGILVRAARSRVYAVLGYANEQRSGHALPRDVRFIRSDPYLSIGSRI
jgi:hypothetical protein